MISLLQRVNFAQVEVDQQVVAKINHGLLIFVGVEKTDDTQNVLSLFNKLKKFRVFTDEKGKTNLSIEDIQGDILLVPQFTLPANTQKGNRPSFDGVASPELGKQYFDELINLFKTQTTLNIQQGVFQAHMKVLLENDGPMTFWIKK